MKMINILCAAVLCFAIAGNAQNVSITGTVSGGGTGINKARVSLKNHPHLVTYTDGSGAFTINGPLPVINMQRSPASLPVSIKNGRLLFTVDQSAGTARIEQFSLTGALLFSQEIKSVSAGTHSIPLMKTAQSITIVKLTIGNESIVLKMAAGGSGIPARQSSAIGSGNPGKIAAASGGTDSLLVVARGWKNAIVNLPSFSGQFSVTLTASSPWNPTGALVKEKGMVKIMAKGYNFEMGQSEPVTGSDGQANFEQPVHTVEFTYDYWMDTTEVTQKAYTGLMKSTYADFGTPQWDSHFGLGDRYPVYRVYWGNAALYCNARSKSEGLDTVYRYESISAPPSEECELVGVTSDLTKNGYRLPTEAEWEYACKGGSSTDFYWGKNAAGYPATAADTAEINGYEVWMVNSYNLTEGVAGYGNHEVAGKKPNPYGLYDMAGNASEHCQDFWADSYDYGTVVDQSGPASGEGHPIRGGNWGFETDRLRSANRNYLFEPPSYPFFFVGFRTVRPVR